MPFSWAVFALVALLATLSVTEMVRVFAHRLSAVDRPGGRRVHRRPTARLGGLGIFWGFYVAMALATYGNPSWAQPFDGDDLGLIGMMVGSCLLLIVGVVDDVYGVPATIKLGFQVAAGILLYGFGWRVETVGFPGLDAWPVGALALPATVLWVLLVTNAINLIDGLDGLACGMALVTTVAVCILVAPQGGPLLLAAAALVGALVGFLWFNLNPALIFMGDAGSLFVGFVLSGMTLRLGQLSAPESFPLVPVLLLLVPLFDTCDAIRRRTLAAARGSRTPGGFLRAVRSRVFSPDSHHVHHRLMRAGLPTRAAVGWLWAAGAAFAACGLLVHRAPAPGLLLLGLLALVARRAFRELRARSSGTASAATPDPMAAFGESDERAERRRLAA